MPVLTKKTTAIKHPMPFMELYADIGMELSVQPNIGVVRAEINKVIRRVNDEIGLWREMVRVSAGKITTGWEDLEVNNWNNEDEQNWDMWGKFRFGWDYDEIDFILRLSDIVVEVEEVYFDNEEWQPVPLETLHANGNESEKIFTQIGRYLYFNFDLATSTKICDIRVKQSYSYIESVVTRNTNIDLPESYRQMLISGALIALTNREPHKDPDVYAVNKEVFEREYEALKNQYINLEVEYTQYDQTYKY